MKGNPVRRVLAPWLLIPCLLAACGGGNDGAGAADPAAEVLEHFRSAFGLGLENLYWGELHAHTSDSLDAALCGAADPAAAYAFARDAGGSDLDFVGLSDHAEFPNPDLSPADGVTIWREQLRVGAAFNNEDPAAGKLFIVFPGWEYTNTHGMPSCTSSTGYGHKNVVFKDFHPVPPGRLGACVLPEPFLAGNAQDLWARLSAHRPPGPGAEGTALTLVHTPAHCGPPPEGDEPVLTDHQTDWDAVDPDFVRHVEIHSKWGSSEGPCPAAAGCAGEDPPFEGLPGETLEDKTVRTVLHHRWVEGGDERFLLAFVGGTDNHLGHPGAAGEEFCDAAMHFRGSVTGVAAPALTRDGLWSALWNRHTMACTTGGRIPLLMAVSAGGVSTLMGGRAAVPAGPVRLLAVSAEGVPGMDLIVDGCLTLSVDAHWIDATVPLAPGRHYLYVRARAQNAERDLRAWSSPVYLDVGQPASLVRAAPAPRRLPVTPPAGP